MNFGLTFIVALESNEQNRPDLNGYSSGRRGGENPTQNSYAPRYSKKNSESSATNDVFSGYGKYNVDQHRSRRDNGNEKYSQYKDRGRERSKQDDYRDMSPMRNNMGRPQSDRTNYHSNNSYDNGAKKHYSDNSSNYRDYGNNDYKNSNYSNHSNYKNYKQNYNDLSSYENTSADNAYDLSRSYNNYHNYNDKGYQQNNGISNKNRLPSGPRNQRGRDRYQENSGPANKNHDQDKIEPTFVESNELIEQQIKEIEKKLEKYTDFPLIEDIKVLDSRWDTKPKGFENVTAQRAKLSGLFPLPGYPRPVDFTKLEGLLKEESSDLLTKMSRIDAIDSRSAKTLIIKNLNFEEINYLKVVEFFNDYLKHIDINETSTNNIISKRKTKDDKTLIVEFTNNTCATIIRTLDKIQLSFNLYKEDTRERADEEKKIELHIERPQEYVVQTLPAYDKINEDDIEETVVDNPRKMTIHISSELTETIITDELKSIAPLKGFQLLREIGTRQSVGIAFLEFYVDPSITDIRSIITILEGYLSEVEDLELVTKAYFSCIIPNVTTIQDCIIDYKTLRPLARNENVSVHPKLNVIQLLNCVTAKDLMEDSSFQFIFNDIKQEVNKFGNVKSIKIPRPANEYTPGLQQFSEPGLGKIFVEFDDDEVAFKAIMSLAGRQYNDRTVLCSFYSHEDYKNGLL